MGVCKFSFLDKQKLDVFLPKLFDILHANMRVIAPTGCSYEEDYAIWYSNVAPAMEKEQRQIVLMWLGDAVVGYFQYYINRDTNSLMMEEIQIQKQLHGTGVFSDFYKWLIDKLPKDIAYVEAYANKKNTKSQGILEHLGLVCVGENRNGKSFYFKGKYADLVRRFC